MLIIEKRRAKNNKNNGYLYHFAALFTVAQVEEKGYCHLF